MPLLLLPRLRLLLLAQPYYDVGSPSYGTTHNCRPVAPVILTVCVDLTPSPLPRALGTGKVTTVVTSSRWARRAVYLLPRGGAYPGT